MELNFLDVLFTVLFLVILVVPGFIMAKFNLLNESAESVLSTIVLYVAQPALMIMSFQKVNFSPKIAVNMLIVAGLAIVVHAVMIGLMFLFIKGKRPRHDCCRTASVFSNCGYMGLPFLQALFPNGEEVLIYAATVIIIFNVFNWSLGIFMISGDKKNINIKNCLLNPTIIAVFLGLIIFLIAKQPIVNLAEEGTLLDSVLTKLMKSINFLAEMVTPLAMFVIGVKLARASFKRVMKNPYIYITCFNKLILMSIISTLVVAFLPVDNYIKYAIFFSLSMPCATSNVMFAVKFGGAARIASVIVLLSTLLSVLTIPLMFELFKLII